MPRYATVAAIRLIAMLAVITACSLTAADLTTLSGKVYRNYTVTKVLADGLEISHAAGISKVPASDLPKALLAQYAAEFQAAKETAQAQNEKAQATAPAPATGDAAKVSEQRQLLLERQAAAAQARQLLMTQFQTEAEPYFATARTTFKKTGGGFAYAARGILIPVLGDKMLVSRAVCTNPNPKLVPAQEFRDQLAGERKTLAERVEQTIPAKIKALEAGIRELEAAIDEMERQAALQRANAQQPNNNAVVSTAKVRELKQKKREVRDLEREQKEQQRKLQVLDKELRAVEQELTKFKAQRR